jgi:mannose/fructose/N-acetylgalactosamine-specific phosphotransferase system component IIC
MRFWPSFAAFILILAGTCVTLFSGAVAFGWWHRILFAAATMVAVIGYAIVLSGYQLVRDTDWESLASGFMRRLLLLGVTLLLPAVIALATRTRADYFPYGYFISTGCLSAIGYLRFRKYAAT